MDTDYADDYPEVDDFDVPEEVADEPGEYSRFVEAQRAAFEAAEEENVLPNLIEEVVAADPNAWLGLLFLHRDDTLREQHANTVYSVEDYSVLTECHAETIPHAKFVGFSYRILGKAIATAVSNIVYSNDGPAAYMAMNAQAECNDDGLWVVRGTPQSKFTVSITSKHAVNLQLFCCSTSVSSVRTTEKVNKSTRVILTPKIVEKNVSQRETMPVEVKRIFKPLLFFKEKKKAVTSTDLQRAPFLWKAIYQEVKNTPIPLDGLPQTLVYMKWVLKDFGYAPKSCPLADVVYAAYPPVLKELSHTVAKHSVLVGGVFVNARHFENEGLKHSVCKHIGGEFSKDLCFYNTNYKVTWERAGACIENPSSRLGTVVAAVRPVEEFDGIWWNPRDKPLSYLNARGFVIPYDRNGVGLNFAKSYAALPQCKDVKWKIWCHYGAMPALWMEKVDARCPEQAKFNPFACDILWKTMGVMGIYNLMASLNRNYALGLKKGVKDEAAAYLKEAAKKGVPVDPIFCLVLNGDGYTSYKATVTRGGKSIKEDVAVPSFIYDFMPPEYLPGRWMVGTAGVNEADGLKDGFAQFAGYAEFLRKADSSYSSAPAPEDTRGGRHVESGIYDRKKNVDPERKKRKI